jgi:hypothetical protein
LLNRMTEAALTEVASAASMTLIIENIRSVIGLLASWIKVVQEEIK